MKPINIIVLVLLLTVSGLALADNPPSLTTFEQFYGTVSGLPSAMPLLKAKVGANTYTTSLAADGKFGYAQVFKVFGASGDVVNFSVANLAGLEVPAGTVAFVGGAVSRLELVYNYSTGASASSAASTAATNDTSVTNDTSTTTSSGSTTRGDVSSSTLNETEELPPGQCRQSWECRLWSECVNGQQIRQCYRIDQCDQLQTAGTVNFTISMPKPDEARACQMEAVVPPAGTLRICSPSNKRCLGAQLQQCADSGESWNTLQGCPWGCDSGTSSCNSAPAAAEQKPVSIWMFVLIGVLVLSLVLGGLFSFLHYKKYAPAKNYVRQCQEQGFSDSQIKSKLVSQGWDEAKIDRMLR